MDNHLGNNKRFSILPGHKSSRHLVVKFSPGRAHLVVAGNKEKQRKARPCEVCNPLSLLSSSSGSSALSINYEHIDGAGAKIISLCFPW